MWHETQTRLADALLANGGGLSESGSATDRRFGIYRNNVVVGLRETLAAAFPTVAALLGDACFNEAARRYAREHPPVSPVLLEYGDSFAAFLEALGLTETLPYVSDVARLDWLRQEAAHAADADSLDIGALHALAGADHDAVALRLHPSLRLLDSDWPVVSIWRAHQQADPSAALAALRMTAERAMVVRPVMDVEVRRIGEDANAMIAALVSGGTLGEALQAALGVEGADPVACLAGLFRSGAVAGVTGHRDKEGMR